MIHKLAAACGVSYALYQSYAIYRLYHPLNLFIIKYPKDTESYEEFSEAKALKRAFVAKNRTRPQLDQPIGEVLVEPYLPLDEIKEYQKRTKSEVFYLNLAEINTIEDYFKYVYELFVIKPEREQLLDDSESLGMHTLLGYAGKELMRSTFEHTGLDGFSMFDPQWILFRFLKLTGKRDKIEKVSSPRYPIIVIDNAHKLNFEDKEYTAISYLTMYWLETLLHERKAHAMMISQTSLAQQFEEYAKLKNKVTS